MRPDGEEGGGDPAASQASCLGSKKNSYNQYGVCQFASNLQLRCRGEEEISQRQTMGS